MNVVALHASANVPVPGCPIASRHWPTLIGRDPRQVDRYTHLIPEDDARAAIAEIEAVAVPMGVEAAKHQAKVLIGSYPHPTVDEPEIYGRAIVSILADVPAEIGKIAVDHLTRALRFLPTRAEVVDECNELVSQRKLAIWVAEKHLAEHARRREERERDEVLRKERMALGLQV